MSKRHVKDTQPVFSAQLRNAIVEVSCQNVPWGIVGRELDDERLWEILGYAAVHPMTSEGACQELARAPSGNTVREHLAATLDDRRSSVVNLEEALTAAL